MQDHPRYEILEQIAVGDFATVFRARDRELNREVAIKQIHPQFLADQRQLERYWQEAQLLASLQHPNIMTIYDIDRSRGWLILELMNGSLRDRAAGQPMDLDYLRMAMVCALQALKFLHEHGIVHGDVKPSNLLIDRRDWVKLGDFGLAQRAESDQGSLLKGTTRYIAPERISDQFGPVGPSSDLYSLGFSIYELMCGEHFDSLFPGLDAFGRDQQIAWMMWHVAADRRAPEISRVLEGVPPEMTSVIERMICKDPAGRYTSADEALRDIKIGLGRAEPGPSEAERAASEEAIQKKKRRQRLILAGCVGAALCLAMVLIPGKAPPKPPPALRPTEGEVKHFCPADASLDPDPDRIDPHDAIGRMVLDNRRTITVRRIDQLYLNDVAVELSALKMGDKLRVTIEKDETGKSFQAIYATRPQIDRGRIVAVQPDYGTFDLEYTASDGSIQQRRLLVPRAVAIRFNGKPPTEDTPQSATDLKIGDRVEVEHDATDDQRVVLTLSVTRVVTTTGKLQGVDSDKKSLTLEVENGAKPVLHTLPLSSRCIVIINGRRFIRNRKLLPTDLRSGDTVVVDHDTHVVKIVSGRILSGEGIVRSVVPNADRLDVELDGKEKPVPFSVIDQADITLADRPVPLLALQVGDRVTVSYDAADLDNPIAMKIIASRSVDRKRWAVVIGMSQYDDKALSSVPHLAGDAKHVATTLIDRYRLASDQTLLLTDVTRSELEEKVRGFLNRIPEDTELLVYFAGHAYMTAAKQSYLAATDFKLIDMEQTGVSLQWLVESMDEAASASKVLLLDSAHAGSGADLRRQPSAQELLLTLEADPEHPLLKSTVVVASSQAGERGQAGRRGGQFALAICRAFEGQADSNQDRHVDIEELVAFVKDAVRSATDGQQTPVRIDPRPAVLPRLSEEAKAILQKMATAIGEEDVDLDAIRSLADQAREAAPDEPETALLWGLALLKAKRPAEAIAAFQVARRAHPDEILPLEGMVWALYQQRKYRQAVGGLVRIVAKLPTKITPDGNPVPEARRILPWVGRLREFAGAAVPETYRASATDLEKIDQAVANSGTAQQRFYQRGRDHVAKVLEAYDTRISETSDKGERLKLQKFERPRLRNYASFSTESAVEQVMDRVEP